MRCLALLAPLLLIPAMPAPAQDLATTVDQKVRALEPKIIAWRRDIHQNPELSNREVRTAKLVADQLRKNYNSRCMLTVSFYRVRRALLVPLACAATVCQEAAERVSRASARSRVKRSKVKSRRTLSSARAPMLRRTVSSASSRWRRSVSWGTSP